MFKEPIETIKEVVEDNENNVFKTALLIIALWLIVLLIKYIINIASSMYLSFSILSLIKILLAPICKVLVPAIIIYVLNKENKVKLPKVISPLSGLLFVILY